MIYLDTSLLLSTFVADAHSARAHAWLGRTSDPLMIADFAQLEFADVLSRALRNRRFNETQFGRLICDFDAFATRHVRRNYGVDDFRDAELFVRDLANKLSAPDALHLASARNAGAALATFDVRLAAAAKAAAVDVQAVE